MRKFYFLLIASLFFIIGNAQIINFPDPLLKAKLLQTGTANASVSDLDGNPSVIDANSNGEIEVSEALNVGYLSIFSNPTNEIDYISDGTGLEMFTNLLSLTISYNHMTSLSLQGLTHLYMIQSSETQIASANFSQMPNLKTLSMNRSQLTSLDNVNLQGTNNIENLRVDGSYLSTADLTGFSLLKTANFSGNNLTNVNITGLVNLEKLQVDYN